MQTIFFIFLFLIGAATGSFLCCQARRLRLRSLKAKSKPLGRRSVCLNCRHQLKWFDNLPIISWLLLKGKCRYCHRRIGVAELLSEIGVGMAFAIVAIGAQPLGWGLLILALIFTSTLAFLAIYDGLYGELPFIYLLLANLLAAGLIVTKLLIYQSHLNFPKIATDLVLSVALLGGLYFILYKVSRGRWVGDGDWILGTAIGLALGTPWLSLIALFLTNFSACLIYLPAAKKTRKIHLAPFFVLAFVLTFGFSIFFNSLML